MGKRVNYEIVGDEGSVGVVLYANNSHPEIEPDALFVRAVVENGSVSEAVRSLLGATYPSADGNHREGQAVFTVDLNPGDREYVVRARPEALFEGRWEVCYFERVDLDGTVTEIDPDTCEPVAPSTAP